MTRVAVTRAVFEGQVRAFAARLTHESPVRAEERARAAAGEIFRVAETAGAK